MLVAEADEARLHEQLHVVVDVTARDVEPDRAPLAAVAQEVLDEAEPHVACVEVADGVQLDHGPLVAGAVALGAQEARDVPVAVEHVHHVVGAERAERQPEQAEHADPRPRHREPEGSRAVAVGLGQPRQLAQRREIGQPRGADLARACHR